MLPLIQKLFKRELHFFFFFVARKRDMHLINKGMFEFAKELLFKKRGILKYSVFIMLVMNEGVLT